MEFDDNFSRLLIFSNNIRTSNLVQINECWRKRTKENTYPIPKVCFLLEKKYPRIIKINSFNKYFGWNKINYTINICFICW